MGLKTGHTIECLSLISYGEGDCVMMDAMNRDLLASIFMLNEHNLLCDFVCMHCEERGEKRETS